MTYDRLSINDRLFMMICLKQSSFFLSGRVYVHRRNRNNQHHHAHFHSREEQVCSFPFFRAWSKTQVWEIWTVLEGPTNDNRPTRKTQVHDRHSCPITAACQERPARQKTENCVFLIGLFRSTTGYIFSILFFRTLVLTFYTLRSVGLKSF